MRRITVDEVRAAIERTGARLVRRRTLNTDGGTPCGCPIGIMALDLTNGAGRFPSIAEAAYELDLDPGYARCFVGAFDGLIDPEGAKQLCGSSDAERLGFEDGFAVAALLPREEVA